MGGGGGGTTTTTAFNLPAGAHPFAQEYLERASKIATDPGYDATFVAYSQSTYAAFQYIDEHYPEREGIDALAARGSAGNASINKANPVIIDILEGDYLNGTDAGFTGMLDDALQKPTDTFNNDVRSKLGASSYLIGDLSGENLAFTLTTSIAARYTDRSAAAIYHGNYQAERGRQGEAIRIVPVYADEPVKNAEALRKAGLSYRIWLHGKYTADYELWQDEQTTELRRTEVLGNAIRSLVGSQTTRTEPYHKPSPLVGMASGAISGGMAGGMAAGAQAGGMTGPQGAVVGALAGAALGYLGSQ